ncbi:MAG: hypothetical protein IKC88_01245, partial [Opitutales bacterium]|nr:hypothetical protein [Opitutales bacterium]
DADSLTGLSNHKKLHEDLSYEIERCSTNDGTLAFCIFDIADRAIFLDTKTRTQTAIGSPKELLNSDNADVRIFLNRGVDPRTKDAKK